MTICLITPPSCFLLDERVRAFTESYCGVRLANEVNTLYGSSRVPRWSEAELSVLRKNINQITYSKLSVLLPGRTIDAIKRRADMVGLPRHSKRPVWRALNENFFSDQSLASAYWAGFIAADGCIVTSPRQEVRIGIHKRDRALLEKFREDTGFDGSITQRGNICYITVCAASKWISDLASIYNIGPRKTMTLRPPNLPFTLNALAYSIGYIDGDGCWATSLSRYGKRSRMLVVVGTASMLMWMKSLWFHFGAPIGQSNPRPNKGCWRFATAGSPAVKLAEILNVVPVDKLERKWRIARGEATHQPEERSLEH